MTQKTTLKISGMTCGHCVSTVKDIIEELEGINKVNVSLENGGFAEIEFGQNLTEQKIIKHINETGVYKVD